MNETLESFKAVAIALLLLFILQFLWNAVGFDQGSGGNPQEGYEQDY